MDSAVRRMSSVLAWVCWAVFSAGYCSRRSRLMETCTPVSFQWLLYRYLLESYW